MIFTDARIFTPLGWVRGGFRVENGRFVSILPGAADPAGTGLNGAKVLPGLVDIHIHGASGADASDGDGEGLFVMGRYLARRGVTAFLPTLMSLPAPDTLRALAAVRSAYRREASGSARILGVRTEGPFLSDERRGSHNRESLRAPDMAEYDRMDESALGVIRILDLAPELPGAGDLIRHASRQCRVSLGHTAADYDTAAAAFDAGACHVTHLYNAMPPLGHRSPGLIGAAAERSSVTAELICDGVHVHPSAVRLAFRMFPERLCLVSDALRCCGRGDGTYRLGGQSVTVRGGEARLSDGTLAGSVSDLSEGLRNAVRFGVDEQTAIRAATVLPARAAGADGEIGTIEPGKYADFLVCGDDLSVREVYLSGERTG